MNLKEQVGYKAVDFVKDGMVVGLGTGSTVFYFIHALAKKVKEGLNVEMVSTSIQSIELAESLGMKVKNLEEVDRIDICIDGVDEIDKDFNAIKGGGAALFREKIVADIAEHVVWIYDESKDVEKLGAFNLPVEILPFAYNHTIRKMEELGLKPVLRYKDDKVLVTDNGNFIVDLHLGYGFDIKSVENKLASVVGLVEHGLFLNTCKHCIKGTPDGPIIIENPNK
ncbi:MULTISPECIES: ribose-5-phosphate isomerase RpiA [unclassified Gemella]|uniref:ribose-5-phosphate isomerase RpiA n=1 Tax=unclassified Gemella TaxID=2624949 RepID=UPI0010737AC7|nr:MULTISPECIES: ribose-5-phosphate isomerase RpiA [unclassified Gemella]MBF0709935.1 ribose-5-phosphate isomerase RpiA [Gemella sp. GL1.1]MBF0746761.1 ribose-5-phosphate isomerase RpiA [Gemella sp. 19428wG2_WT2a]NYS27279.1 ribose-5-phosphate isomerase RpiA [Gemella sp. GL1]TFU59486.1 ribose-5-phosphate isomerase RpiA [Gemella sp. WT2a]